MYRINVSKLRGKMGEKQISMTALSKEIGVNRNTLTTYFRVPDKIPYNVLAKMASYLCENSEEATDIFFTQ